MSKSTEELQQEIRAIIKSPMKSKVSTADIAVGMMSSTALSEKVIQLSGLFDQELAKRVEEARIEVVEWLEADLKRLDSRNWTMDTMVLDHMVASGKADDYQKNKRQQIVEDRRAAHALYAILNNYKATLNNQTKENQR